tara:strand:+ start:284 stop:562 length:279 start_codon:yes stop_codon:yes gene_type:complete
MSQESIRIYMGWHEWNTEENNPDEDYDSTCLELMQEALMKALQDVNEKIVKAKDQEIREWKNSWQEVQEQLDATKEASDLDATHTDIREAFQ